MNIREEIIEYLIIHQPGIKMQLEELKTRKDNLLATVDPILRSDVDDQYKARIQQYIAFQVGKELAVPIEQVILELERIDIEEYLNVEV